MKPNFTLEMSHTGIKLLDLTSGMPVLFGEVSLDDPDFDEKIAALRNRAAETSDVPMVTELVIPNSEILFTTLDHPKADAMQAAGGKSAAREAAVRDELEGMTPYALDDLVYLWRLKSRDELAVAAVARDTLAEAEDFAATRGFNPVRFIARPERSKFGAPVNFGETSLIEKRRRAEAAAAEARAAAEAQERADAEARAKARPKSPEPAPAPASGAEESPPPTTMPPPETPPDVAATGAEEPLATPAKSAGATPDAPRPRMSLAMTDTAAPADGEATGAGGPADAPAPKGPKDAAAPGPVPHGEGERTPEIAARRTPLNADAPTGAELDEIPPAPLSFTSRRKPVAPLTAPAPAGDGKESRLSRLAARFGAGPDGPAALPGADVPPPPPRRPQAGQPGKAPTLGAGKVNPAALARANGPVPALRGSGGSGPKPGARAPLNGNAPRVTPTQTAPDADSAAASLKAKPIPGTPDLGRGPLNEAEAMTVFGARAKSSGRRAFLPVAVGLVVAVVLAVGVWTAVFLLGERDVANPTPEADESALARLGDPVAPAAEAIQDGADPASGGAPGFATPDFTTPDAPETEIAALPEVGGPIGADTAGAGQPQVPDAPVDSTNPRAPSPPQAPEAQPETATDAPAPLPPRPSPDPLQRALTDTGVDGDAVVARYATTGVWERAPESPEAPSIDRIDGLYAASLDAALTPVPVTPLPRPPVPTPPSAQLPPPPPGQTFDLDRRGLVEATPEGALSPTGILVTAGAPPVRPPEAPNRPTSLAPTPDTQPDLPTTRPRDRPADLSDDGDQTQVNVDTATVRVAGIVPRPRPEDIAGPADKADDAAAIAALANDAAATAARAAQEASAAVATTAPVDVARAAAPPRRAPENLVVPAAVAPGAVADAVEEALESAEPISPYAVAQSLNPRDRPARLAAAAAQRFAAAPPAPAAQQPAVTRVASPAAVTTPRIPSSASVAQRATIKNAINLGDINLIGVYGSTSNRRALVRLPSGKFVKVKVGDRVDGGRVAAIGQSNLSYTKRGRRVTLSMPRS